MWYIYGMLISMFAYYTVISLIEGGMDNEVPIVGVLTYLFWPVGIPLFVFGLLRSGKI